MFWKDRVYELVNSEDVRRGYMFIRQEDVYFFRKWVDSFVIKDDQDEQTFKLTFMSETYGYFKVFPKGLSKNGCLQLKCLSPEPEPFCPFIRLDKYTLECNNISDFIKVVVDYTLALEKDVQEKNNKFHGYFVKNYMKEVDDVYEKVNNVLSFDTSLRPREVEVLENVCNRLTSVYLKPC